MDSLLTPLFLSRPLPGQAPKYIGETAPSEIRGVLLSCMEISIIIGICISYAIGYGSSQGQL